MKRSETDIPRQQTTRLSDGDCGWEDYVGPVGSVEVWLVQLDLLKVLGVIAFVAGQGVIPGTQAVVFPAG